MTQCPRVILCDLTTYYANRRRRCFQRLILKCDALLSSYPIQIAPLQLGKRVAQTANVMKPQEIANSLWSFAQLARSPG
jgi:hypothetical protein